MCHALAIKAHVVARHWQEGICNWQRDSGEAWSTTVRACPWADALALLMDRGYELGIWPCAQSCAEAKAWQQVLALASRADVDAALAGTALSVVPKALELLEAFRRQWIKGLEWPASAASAASSASCKAGGLGVVQLTSTLKRV